MPKEHNVSDQNSASLELDDAWIAKHYEQIHRSAWLLTGSAEQAQDLAQETFLRALKGWDSFQGRCSEATWLTAILLNLHRTQCRSLGRSLRRLQLWFESQDESRPKADDPAVQLAALQWRESIWSEVAKLPSQQQHAILLRFQQGLSFEEIAKVQNCPVGSAKTRVHYGLKKLRPNLVKEDLSETTTLKALSRIQQSQL